MKKQIKKQKYRIAAVCMFAVIALIISGCRTNTASDTQPVTVSIWHVYGGQTDSPLNDMIDEFNRTEGKDKGVRVEVASVSNTNTIHEGVLAAANNEPGAAKLPDMFVSYPKTVLAMPNDSILVDYRDYFKEEELNVFLEEFLKEGEVNGRQTILPIGKSTEIMFINQTAFDRFAEATGASQEELKTWEGLFTMAEAYEEWCGKPFFVHDYHFNYFQVGVEALGGSFFQEDTIAFDETFEKIWEPYARAAVKGGLWLQSGYATEPLRTGDAVVSVASSASILYYSDEVTYPDNTSEKIKITAMPCPVFEDGERLVMQRGGGICTVKSDPEREKACITFLKWLTAPENNVKFVTQTGYMPVTKEAFESFLPEAIEQLEDAKYRELYKAFLETQENYQFYTPPQLENYLELETSFEKNIRLYLNAKKENYEKEDPDIEVPNEMMLEAYQNLKALY